MLKDVEWAKDGTYRPNEEFSPERFFNDGLKNSCSFDLQLGYFSSATISVLAEGFATFISNGGNMRLVINQIVSEEDKKAITNGMMGEVFDCLDLSNFTELRKTFDEYQEQFFRCLSYLIAQKRIEIRIIKPKERKELPIPSQGNSETRILSLPLLVLRILRLVGCSTTLKKSRLIEVIRLMR